MRIGPEECLFVTIVRGSDVVSGCESGGSSECDVYTPTRCYYREAVEVAMTCPPTRDAFPPYELSPSEMMLWLGMNPPPSEILHRVY